MGPRDKAMTRTPRKSTDQDSDSLPFLTLVPNMVTMLGLCAGLTAIRFVMSGHYQLAVGLLLVAAVVDGLDGLLARRLQATSEIGAQLDSLSDFLNFGVAPGLLVYQFALAQSEKAGGWIFVLLYASCCCMRLARFNVAQNLAVTTGTKAPAHFIGVPAPAGALMVLLPVFIAFETGLDLTKFTVLVELYLALIGFLMVSRMPTFSPKSIRVPRKHAGWLMIALALIVGIMLAEFWASLIAIIMLYSASLFYSFIKHLRRNRP